jgi:hypothetical protein
LSFANLEPNHEWLVNFQKIAGCEAASMSSRAVGFVFLCGRKPLE